MKKRFKPYDLDSPMLLPNDLRDFVPQNHLAHFIVDVVSSADLSAFHAHYLTNNEGETGVSMNASGQPPYDCRMMLSILLLGYCFGIRSSRQLARACHENTAFMYVSGMQRPDFRSISQFRLIHLPAFENLFVQVIQLAKKLGMIRMGHLAIDSTRIKASAAKDRNIVFEDIEGDEAKLREMVSRLIKESEEAEKIEDETKGTKDSFFLPEELKYRQNRLDKIDEAKKELGDRAEKRAENARLKKEILAKEGIKTHVKQYESTPQPKDSYNTTDSDSRILIKNGAEAIQGYSLNAAIDSSSHLILAISLAPVGDDSSCLISTIERAEEITELRCTEVSADTGYYSEYNIKHCQNRAIDPLIPPSRTSKDLDVRNEDLTESSKKKREAIRKRLFPITYAQRKWMEEQSQVIRYGIRKIVEGIFGSMKTIGNFRQLLLRGKSKALGECYLAALGHNLRTMHALLRTQ